VNSYVINMDGGYRRALVADQHKAMATTVPVRLRPQSALGAFAAVAVSGVIDATLGRSGGQLA
jgi:hypothetical protein